MDHHRAEVDEQFEHLERRLRQAEGLVRLQFMGGLVVVLVAILLSVGRASTAVQEGSTVRAPFQVVDAEGHPLIRIDATGGVTQLEQFDGKGERVAWLDSTNGGRLVMCRNGKGVVWIGSNAEGGLLATFSNEERMVTRVSTQPHSRGGEVLLWSRTTDVPVASLSALEHGQGASLGLSALRGGARANLRTTPAGGILQLFRSGGKSSFSAP